MMAAPASSRSEADRAQVQDALTGLVSAFATDGYILRIVDLADGHLKMAIDAQEGACAECLVPHEMMAGLVRNSLPAAAPVSTIEIEYPPVEQ